MDSLNEFNLDNNNLFENKYVNCDIQNTNRYENFQNSSNSPSTDCTDNYLTCSKSNRKKNGKNSTKTKPPKEKQKKNSKYSYYNVRKKIMTHFQNFLVKKKLKNLRLKKIPYKINTQGTKNYLMNIFKLSIKSYFEQKLPNGKILNKKILKKTMPNKESKKFLERNFLEVFYNDFVPILKEDYRKKNKIDDKEFEVWEKIIKSYEKFEECEKCGFYKNVYEINQRNSQIIYKIVSDIFKIEKVPRNRNSNINLDNQNIGDNNQNVNSNLSSNYNLRNNTNNNSAKNNNLLNVSSDLHSFNQEEHNCFNLSNNSLSDFDSREDTLSIFNMSHYKNKDE